MTDTETPDRCSHIAVSAHEWRRLTRLLELAGGPSLAGGKAVGQGNPLMLPTHYGTTASTVKLRFSPPIPVTLNPGADPSVRRADRPMANSPYGARRFVTGVVIGEKGIDLIATEGEPQNTHAGVVEAYRIGDIAHVEQAL